MKSEKEFHIFLLIRYLCQETCLEICIFILWQPLTANIWHLTFLQFLTKNEAHIKTFLREKPAKNMPRLKGKIIFILKILVTPENEFIFFQNKIDISPVTHLWETRRKNIFVEYNPWVVYECVDAYIPNAAFIKLDNPFPPLASCSKWIVSLLLLLVQCADRYYLPWRLYPIREAIA